MFQTELGDRHTRRPRHQSVTESMPWEIQPFLVAPVLPGETLAHLTLQARVVTPPLKSRLVGWWLEYYIFYVPFRQMPDAANLVAMFVDPSLTLSATAASARDYYNGEGYNFTAQCLQVVVQEWFRREGEVWSDYPIRANRPAASIGIDNLSESLIDSTLLPDGGAIAGMNVDDLDRARMVLEYRRQLRESGGGGGATDYEEVLASYGASLRRAKDRDRPELLRYVRQWQYPTNTVEPTTGVPTTAVSWAITDRADKPRSFVEPGFIFGVQVIRPKVYQYYQGGIGSLILDRAQRWLPPVMDETGMERSLAEFAAADGPYAGAGYAAGYWLDVRDLFNHGDQFYDVAIGSVGLGNVISSPDGAAARGARYGNLTVANTFMTVADTLSVADTSVSLQIKTRAVDPS